MQNNTQFTSERNGDENCDEETICKINGKSYEINMLFLSYIAKTKHFRAGNYGDNIELGWNIFFNSQKPLLS